MRDHTSKCKAYEVNPTMSLDENSSFKRREKELNYSVYSYGYGNARYDEFSDWKAFTPHSSAQIVDGDTLKLDEYNASLVVGKKCTKTSTTTGATICTKILPESPYGDLEIPEEIINQIKKR